MHYSNDRPAMQRHRIILAGGYTAGHIHPLIAVGREFEARDREILVVGDNDGPEAEIVPRFGFALRTIASAPLRGVRGSLQHARAWAAAASAVWEARRLLNEAPVALVAGFGGYVSAAPIVAARTLGIPTAIFEANAIPGLANRHLRRIADVRFAGLGTTTQQPGWSDAIVSGHPILDEVLRVARSRSRTSESPLRILVTAGLRGSPFLNAVAPALADELQRRGITVFFHHQSGSPTGGVRDAYARLGAPAMVESFIADMPDAFARCDAVVCAGGAGTLSELAVLGLPTLIVPIASTADDHQTANARAFASQPQTLYMSEREFDVCRAVDALMHVMRARFRRALRGENAAAVVVDHCERLIVRRDPAPRRLDPIERAS